MPRAIVLSLDQLSRRCLGAYGHEWIETPHFDRLAARGVLFDQCFASPVPEDVLRQAAAKLDKQLTDGGVLVRRLRETDASAAEELAETPFGGLIAEAESALAELQGHASSWLLWMDSAGIGWPGVATSPFLELYADELDDEVPEELIEVREIEIAYAALLTQFDHLLGQLVGAVERLFGDDPPLLIIVAEHGEPICETELLLPFANRSADAIRHLGSLRDEVVHVPLLIANATGEKLGSRRSELVTPSDLVPTLADWFEQPYSDVVATKSISLMPLLKNEEAAERAELFLLDDEGNAALRTRSMLLVQPNAVEQLATASPTVDLEDVSALLFHKPEDAWEVNNVADQFPDQLVAMQSALRDWLRAQPT